MAQEFDRTNGTKVTFDWISRFNVLVRYYSIIVLSARRGFNNNVLSGAFYAVV